VDLRLEVLPGGCFASMTSGERRAVQIVFSSDFSVIRSFRNITFGQSLHHIMFVDHFVGVERERSVPWKKRALKRDVHVGGKSSSLSLQTASLRSLPFLA
jgi:hypothetical protein